MTELPEFSTSEKLTEFSKALSNLQALGLFAKKDAKNPHFKSKYATLPSVLEALREPLSKNGFSVLQIPFGGIDTMRLLIRINHSSGEWVQWVFQTPLSKKDPQGIGSAITYLRRYSLTASFGLPEEDDDGNGASSQQRANLKASEGKPDVYVGNAAQNELIKELCESYHVAKEDKPELLKQILNQPMDRVAEIIAGFAK